MPPEMSAESRTVGSTVAPLARIFGLYSAVFWPFFAYVEYSFPLRGASALEDTLLLIVLSSALLSVLAWLTASSIALAVVVSNSGITVTVRTFGRRRRWTRVIPWSSLRPRLASEPVMGTVSILTNDVGRFVILTKEQAKAILADPNCPIRDIPPKLARKLGRAS